MKTFNPVQPEKRTLRVAEQEELWPKHAVITLTPIVEKKSKMIIFSSEAIKALGITEDSNRVGLAKGFVDETETKVGYFIYNTPEEHIQYVNAKGNSVKLNTAKVHSGTRSAMSSKYHQILGDYHTADTNVQKHFLLREQYDGGYWLLEEFNGDDIQKTPAAELRGYSETRSEDSNFENVGQEVEVTVEG
jgi:hypothetical protein